MKKSYIFFGLLVIAIVIVYSVMTYGLYARIGAFGCGDECHAYASGYFLNRGRALYSQIFYNHQPMMAYLSAGIQLVTRPTSLYALVLIHRAFIAFYTFGMIVLIIWRFRLAGALFSLIYLGTNVYSYGNQFIGEAVIVYPLAYLLGLVWESFDRKKLGIFDMILSGIFFLCILLTREPYIPVTVVLFSAFLGLHWKDLRVRKLLGILVIVAMVISLWLPGTEYFRQVVTANLATMSLEQARLPVHPVLYAFLYPIIVLLKSSLSYFGRIEAGLSIFLFVSAIIWWKKTKGSKPICILFFSLGLAGLRVVSPGTMYFEAFHMLPWYGLLCMGVAILLAANSKYRIGASLTVLFVLFSLYAFLSPNSFIWERVDRMPEFESQYAKYTQYSQAIKILSNPDQTLFLDMWDDIIYWESGRGSSFTYSLFIPVEVWVPYYAQARLSMFRETPPDFYYSCPNVEMSYNKLPVFVSDMYIHLLSGTEPGCLYVKKSLHIPEDRWERVKSVGISRPKLVE